MNAQKQFIRFFTDLTHKVRKARSADAARTVLRKFLDRCETDLGTATRHLSAPEHYIALACIRAIGNIIAERNEQLAGCSTVDTLWRSLRAKDNDSDVASEAFWQDILHVFLGAIGRSGVYKGVSTPDFLKMSGREAGRSRSEDLNRLAASVRRAMRRYHSGLEPAAQIRRRNNRTRILKALGASVKDWNSYRWQLAHVIRDHETLGRLVELTAAERKAIRLAVEHRVPFAITPYYASLMDRRPHRHLDHAVRAQVIPPLDYVQAVIAARAKRPDSLNFMGELDTSPVDLVVRRYAQIAIFKPFNTCAQICVYCQRNWEIDDTAGLSALASPAQIRKAVAWFRRQRDLEEVLITGGDPLVLPDRIIARLLEEFASMPHIRRVRIGTRVPVVLPMRFTRSLLGIFRRFHADQRPLSIVTHFEHPYEITPDARKAVKAIRRLGMSVYNQQVFTTENSRRFETAALRAHLKSIGIDPYYCFNAQGKEETRAYRVPIARILQERKEEARLTPGVVRTDEPVFNVPRLGKNYLRAGQDHAVIGLTPDGRRVYEFLPWEKNLYPSPTSIYRDVPIYEYLCTMAGAGENPYDYRNIWYYF